MGWKKSRRNRQNPSVIRAEQLESRRLLAIAVGKEFRVNTYTTLSQNYPAIASDANGDFVVTWLSYYQGNDVGSGIFAQRYNSLGVKQGPEFLVSTITTVNQRDPSVAMDDDGNFVIAWDSVDQDGDSYGIYAQRYNAAGVAQGGESQVNTFTTGVQNLPVIAMDGDGNFVIAWQSAGQDGDAYGIYARRFDSTGAALGTEFLVNSFMTGAQLFPAVTMNADGASLIAWQSLGQDGDGLGVYAQFYDASGAALRNEFIVNAFTTGNQGNPTVAMDGDGDVVIAFTDFGTDGTYTGGIEGQFFFFNGSQGGEEQVNTFTTSFQEGASVATDEAGNFIVTWESYNQDGDGYGIYAQRYTRTGPRLGGEFRVNTFTTGNQTSSAVAIDEQGDYVVAWVSHGQVAPQDDVFAQRFTQPVLNDGTLTIHGTSGKESVSLIRAIDDLIVTEKNDVVTVKAADVARIRIDMGAGDDSVSIGTGIIGASIDGGSGNDTITGGDKNETILGNTGKDKLTGGRGKDLIKGGDNADKIFGGNDADKLFGDGANDLIDAGDGKDTAHGGDGNDTILGGNQDDSLLGEAGNDSLDGGADNDRLFGGADQDIMLGNTGNDLLTDNADNLIDQFNGGAGTDTAKKGKKDVLKLIEIVL